MNFTAIDFETANSLRTSACSIGLVKVQNGRIVDELYTLINPLTDFSAGNIRVHGIEPHMVDDAPTFDEVWPQLAAFIGEDILVAHNVTFDASVLTACLQRYDIDYAPMRGACSCQMARKAWPYLKSYRLNAVSHHLHIALHHHHALEDARAAAQIVIEAAYLTQCFSIEALLQSCNLSMKVIQ